MMLVSIKANEPLDADDIQGATFGTDDRSFKLAAEREGRGTGRIYTVTHRATETSGNSTTGTAQSSSRTIKTISSTWCGARSRDASGRRRTGMRPRVKTATERARPFIVE